MLLAEACCLPPVSPPALAGAPVPPLQVMVDTDLGDDIDDAFALALLLRAPRLHLLAVSASLGDTRTRARLVRWLLDRGGGQAVPVYAGPPTRPATEMTQRVAAQTQPMPPGGFSDAVDALLARLRAMPPHSVTLLALAPPTTVAAMIGRDPVAFRRLQRVVMMGGAIERGYPGERRVPGRPPGPEYNAALAFRWS